MSLLKVLEWSFVSFVVTACPSSNEHVSCLKNINRKWNGQSKKKTEQKPKSNTRMKKKNNRKKKTQIKIKFGVVRDITCLVVVPPGSVIGASVIIDWFDFVPTLKLLLPGNACWMVIVPLPLPPLPPLLFVVGVWGVWFTPFPLALLQFNDPDDGTNGKLIVTERSSLIVCMSFVRNVRQNVFSYPMVVQWLLSFVCLFFSSPSLLQNAKMVRRLFTVFACNVCLFADR